MNILPSARIDPGWPGRPYTLSCPPQTLQQTCDLLTGSALGWCFEPEADTHEVLNALLARCDSLGAICLYVDVGCNVGYFAAQAAALGARVDCYEPTPFFVNATKSTFARNRFPTISNITQAAVVTWQRWQQAHQQSIRRSIADLAKARSNSTAGAEQATSRPSHPTVHFTGTYTPCGVGERDQKAHSSGRHGWDAPLRPIRQILHHRK